MASAPSCGAAPGRCRRYFTLIQQRGQVAEAEMYHVFNMGIGLVAVVAPADASAVQAAIGEETFIIGELVAGAHVVTLA